jgi:hypothetical protein
MTPIIIYLTVGLAGCLVHRSGPRDRFACSKKMEAAMTALVTVGGAVANGGLHKSK